MKKLINMLMTAEDDATRRHLAEAYFESLFHRTGIIAIMVVLLGTLGLLRECEMGSQISRDQCRHELVDVKKSYETQLDGIKRVCGRTQ